MTSHKQQDAESPQTQDRPTGTPAPSGKTPSEQAHEHDSPSQATTEDFGREGMGVAGKE